MHLNDSIIPITTQKSPANLTWNDGYILNTSEDAIFYENRGFLENMITHLNNGNTVEIIKD